MSIEAIHQREAELVAAMALPGTQTLDALLGDELSWTHASAKTDDKPSLLASFASDALVGTRLVLSDRVTRLHGSAAVVTGVAEVLVGTATPARQRYTSVWRQTDAGWQLIAMQFTTSTQ